MVLAIATRGWDGWASCVDTWYVTAKNGWLRQYVVCNKDVLPAYQEALERTTQPIIAFIHDDVEIYEKNWDTRVLAEFSDPAVGVVGLAGGLGHGTPNLYTVPYYLPNLARQNFLSNMRDAEKHGARFAGTCDVAILDGLALFVRRSILEKAGGWPLDKPVGYYMYSEWLCCEARRQGYRIRLVGVDCLHLGGKTATLVQLKDDYQEAHRYFYENNRDVLPYNVEEK